MDARAKPQAQKKLEREALVRKKEEERNREKELYKEKIEKEVAEKKDDGSEKVLTKQELRKQKKALKHQQAAAKAERAHQADGEDQSAIGGGNQERASALSSTAKVIKATLAKAVEAADAEAAAIDRRPAARVVLTHSTHCAGLKPVLMKLQRELPGCTIIPGAIAQVQAKCDELELRFQRTEENHTYKFVARHGRTVQDVSITVSKPDIFTKEIVCEKIQQILTGESPNKPAAKAASEDLRLGDYNRMVYAARKAGWKEGDQEQSQKMKEQEKAAKVKKMVDKQRRTLVTKGISSGAAQALAERDVEILTGERRGKHAMG